MADVGEILSVYVIANGKNSTTTKFNENEKVFGLSFSGRFADTRMWVVNRFRLPFRMWKFRNIETSKRAYETPAKKKKTTKNIQFQ